MNASRSRPRVLFVCEAATLAHVARSLVLASSLDPARYAVTFAVSHWFDHIIPIKSVTRRALDSRSPADFAALLARGGVLFDESVLRRYVQQELSLFRDVRPHVVVGDLRPSLAISAAAMEVPLVTLTNAYWSPYAAGRQFPVPALRSAPASTLRGGFGRLLLPLRQWGFDQAIPRILEAQLAGQNAMRRAFGLSPFKDYLTGFVFGDATAYLDRSELFPLRGAPESHQFVGPVSWEPQVDLPAWWSEIVRSPNIAYVCLGSSGRGAFVPFIARALRERGYTVVVSTAGENIPLATGAGIFVAPFLPATHVLRHSQLAVCNGGAPSVYQALQHGVPVLGIPFNMDQLLMMHFVQAAGVGRSIRPDLLSAASLAEALRNLQSPDGNGAVLRQALKGATDRSAPNFAQIIDQVMPREVRHERISGL